MTQVATMTVCAFCGGGVDSASAECPACGNSIVRPLSASAWHAFTPLPAFAALWFLSFGLYSLPWFYRAWRFIRDDGGEDVHPHIRTACLLVPILNLFWTLSLFRRVEDLTDGPAREANIAFAMFWASGFLARYSGDDIGAFDLVCLTMTGAPLWAIQRRINAHYRRTRAITSARMPVYGWVICGLGALVWLMAAVVQLFPAA